LAQIQILLLLSIAIPSGALIPVDRRRARGAVVVHRDLYDLVKRSVGDEQGLAVIAELDAICPERRRALLS
jgi:hypothetical protein